MKIGLLLNSNNELCSYSEKYREILAKNDIPYNLIDPNSGNLFHDLAECSHLLFRHSQGDTDKIIYESIFYIAQNVFKLKCWPNKETFWPYEDKIRQYYLLKSQKFPIVESNVFWNKKNATDFLEDASFPVVVKLSKGASSSNVILVNSYKEGKKIIDSVFDKGVKSGGLKISSNLASLSKIGLRKYSRAKLKSLLLGIGVIKNKADYPEWQIQKDNILFQKYLSGNKYDTRVTIIGKRGFAFRRFVRKNDFRASGSGNFDTNPKKIDLKCLQIAFEISHKLNFVTMAYDFIYDINNQPYINEISYCFVDKAVQNCPGYWNENLEWCDVQRWPQYHQLSDFLSNKDLKDI